MPTHPHVFDLLPAYALCVLDPDDRIEVEAHLAECSVCQEELRAYEALTADLVFSVPPVTPSPSLKQRILASTTPASAPAPASPGARWRRWLDGLRTPGFALAAASAALALILLIGNIVLFARVQNLEDMLVASNQAGLQTLGLTGSEIAPQAWAILVMDKDAPSGLLVVDNLPPLDKIQAYQLWLITPNGQRQNGGVFQVDEKGHGFLEIKSPNLLQKYAAFGVTIEPVGGSPAPTGPNVLKGQNTSGS